MTTLRQGLIAGLLAGLIVASLMFMDYGPAGDLRTVAGWLFLNNQGATGSWIGFFLLIVLGGIFGLLFGALQARREAGLGRSLVLGLATGFVLWLVGALFFGTILHHSSLNFGSFLYDFIPLLVYGVLLGALYFQLTAPRAL